MGRYCILMYVILRGRGGAIVTEIALCLDRSPGYRERANVAVLAVAVWPGLYRSTFVQW